MQNRAFIWMVALIAISSAGAASSETHDVGPAPASRALSFTVAVLTLEVAAPEPLPDQDVACQGTSPITNSCARQGNVACCQFGFFVEPSIEFRGIIENSGSTATFSWRFSCRYLSPLDPGDCTYFSAGGLFVGQAFDMQGKASNYPVGRWRAFVENP